MRKIMSVVLLGLLLMSIIPLGLAQEDTEETEVELEEEAELMSTIQGAQYRLDQLALSLENQIEHAKDILSELELSEEVMNVLNGYVVDMELLLERVKAIEPSGTASEMAAEFVAIKKEAITLTQEFRRTLTSSINQQKIEQVKERVREMKELRQEEFKAQLKEKKENMYMNRLNDVLEAIGADVDDIMQQLENGEITREEARELIRERINAMSEDDHEELREKIKEQAEEAKENFQARKEEAKANFEAKKAEIKANAQEAREQYKERKEEAKANYETKKAEIKANAENRREELKAQFKARLQERKENAESLKEQFKANIQARKLLRDNDDSDEDSDESENENN